MNRKGFTLLELLVVMGIIAILFAIIMPAFSNMRAKTKEREISSQSEALATAIMAYHVDFHEWPGNATGGVWSTDNYKVIRALVNNGRRVYYESAAADLNTSMRNSYSNLFTITISSDVGAENAVTISSLGANGLITVAH